MRSECIPTRLTERRQPPRIAESVAPSRFHVVLVLIIFARLALRLGGLTLRRAPPVEKARAVRGVLEQLGAFWIKVGQMLSMRHDVFSAEFCEELTRLQDVAPGAEFRHIKETVEAELGGRIEELFETFSDTPFAAASIGQLHMARLRTSHVEVAVKVQKPFVSERMRHDLRLVYAISRLCLALGILRFFNWEEFYYELERVAAEEIDYRYEAAAMRQMRKTLKAHGVVVPRPYQDLCTGRVLVMEYISGCLLADYFRVQSTDPERVNRWLQENNVEPAKVVKRLLFSHWRQVFEDNLFHGDLHPGNIVLLRDSRVALIDFGSVGRLDVGFHENFLRYNQAVSDGRFASAADLFLLMAPSLPPGDLERPRREYVRTVRQWAVLNETPGIPIKERSTSRILNRVVGIMAKHRIPVAWDLLRMNRTKITLTGSVQGLDPSYREMVLIKKYFRAAKKRRLETGLQPARMARRAMEATADVGKLIGDGAEAASLELAWMRRRAQNLMLASKKASSFLVIAIDLLCLLALGAAGGLALLWLHQRGIYRAPAEISDAFKGFVRLTPGDWALVAVVSSLVLARLFTARNQIRQTSEQAPSLST